MPRKPVTPAPKAPAKPRKLQFEEGQYVRLGNGRVVGPIKRRAKAEFPWYAAERDHVRPSWTEKGRYYAGGTRSEWDVVAIVPPPGAPAPAPRDELLEAAAEVTRLWARGQNIDSAVIALAKAVRASQRRAKGGAA